MSRQPFVHPSDEERVVTEMARDLEAMNSTSSVQPTEGFADRVMRAIADEPLPQPVRAFGLALLGGRVRAAGSALGDAWRTISSGAAPIAVRAQALALVLVVLVGSLAVAGGSTVGALGLLSGPPSPAPTVPLPSLPAPTPSPSPSPEDTPSATPEDTPSAEPSDTAEPTETSDSHETARPTLRPRTATPTGTDDHGGGSGDSSGSGGGDHTPSPTETDDSSGGDG